MIRRFCNRNIKSVFHTTHFAHFAFFIQISKEKNRDRQIAVKFHEHEIKKPIWCKKECLDSNFVSSKQGMGAIFKYLKTAVHACQVTAVTKV